MFGSLARSQRVILSTRMPDKWTDIRMLRIPHATASQYDQVVQGRDTDGLTKEGLDGSFLDVRPVDRAALRQPCDRQTS